MTDDRARQRFAEVVMPHLDDAMSLARWLTGNRHDAEDVVQDACLRAFRSVNGFSGGSSRAWLLAIVRNTALTWLARDRSNIVVASDDLEAAEARTTALGADDRTAEAMLIAKADAARLDQAIAALPEAFRETVVLRDINGLSYREIADVTGAPVGTVMSRLARARGLLIADLGRAAP